MDRPNTSSEGSLYELVARGQKDYMFLSKEKTAKVPFSYNMGTWPASLDETKNSQPLNAIDFGRTVEWELEIFGDLLISAAFVIELPSWLPPTLLKANQNSQISDMNGTTYGYTNGIGAFLFENIQFYQDQLLLQEFSGDFLYAWTHLQSSLCQESLTLIELGAHSGSALDIQRNATPKKLYLRLPLIGCAHPDDGGFPFVAIAGQKYRIRCRLRRLEDLVESSSQAVKPAPWALEAMMIQTASTNQEPVTFQPLAREQITKPLITLETVQRYVRQDLQKKLRETSIQIPFIRPFENILSIDPSDYIAVGNGSTSYISKRIDGRHPGEGVLVLFQSEFNIERNQLWNFYNPINNGDYYNTMKFLVAGKDREAQWDSMVWQELSQITKAEKPAGIPISWLSFTYGPAYGYKAPERRKPSGTLNFSMADRPTLWMDIKDTLASTLTQQKRTTLRAITIGWGIYSVEGQRGSLLFAN